MRRVEGGADARRRKDGDGSLAESGVTCTARHTFQLAPIKFKLPIKTQVELLSNVMP